MLTLKTYLIADENALDYIEGAVLFDVFIDNLGCKKVKLYNGGIEGGETMNEVVK